MSLKATNKVDTNRYELEIVIDGDSFKKAIQTVYNREKKNIAVQGFRKGKAPLSIIEKYYGEGVFYEDALNLLYADAIDAAAKEAGLTVIEDEMKFDLVSISKEEGVDFKVALTTKPEVEVAEYKGLAAEKLICEVTDDEVTAELERMADRNSRMVEVTDRAAAMGDTAVIDFEGFVDGTAFDGGKGEGYSLGLGSGQFIPGFEEQLVGKNVDEECDVNVTFPEEYHAAELAGKPAVFKCKIHEIQAKELPELNDDFAKDVSDFDTLEELKADCKAKLEERRAAAAEEGVSEQLVDGLLGILTADIPAAMFENAINEAVQDFEYRLQSQGLSLEMYMQYTGSDKESFRETFREQAEKKVKMRLILEKIAKLENIVPTAEDIEAEYNRYAEMYQMEAAQIKAFIPETALAEDLAVQKAMDFVKENAKIRKSSK